MSTGGVRHSRLGIQFKKVSTLGISKGILSLNEVIRWKMALLLDKPEENRYL